jgi:hypothetical protein
MFDFERNVPDSRGSFLEIATILHKPLKTDGLRESQVATFVLLLY